MAERVKVALGLLAEAEQGVVAVERLLADLEGSQPATFVLHAVAAHLQQLREALAAE